jgi:hypothetical protein
MPSIVTMDVYSGRPNPTWVVDDDKVADLQRMAGAAAAASLGPLPMLGYRGFHVRPVESEHAAAARVQGMPESVSGAGDAVIAGQREAEEFLLSTAAEHIDEQLRSQVREAIARGPDRAALQAAAAAAAVKCPTCHAADAPVYNPAFWNTPARQPHNNCYNYANDQATNTFAQPGRATGHPITALSCPGVQPSATSDGLHACPNFAGTLGPGHGWYVALVIWPGNDYHWYRQDKVGCWSHKPGQTAARNTDNSGHAIADPRTCNRGPYTNFCTYMITTRHVRIR